MQQPEQSLTYEEDQITNAIRRLDGLMSKAKPGTSAEEFYRTIYEVMMTLDASIVESRNMRRAYDKMCCRVEIMERMMSMLLKLPKFEQPIKNEGGKTSP